MEHYRSDSGGGCYKPRVDGATQGTEELDSEDVEDEREDCDHLEEEKEARGKRHHIPAAEVVQEILEKQRRPLTI